MKLGIMQPYFLPYLGYFQLIKASDEFVLYDNIKFTKSGWIQRNRMLVNGKDTLFSIPLKKASDHLDIRERELAADYEQAALKLLRAIREGYRKAPYFSTAWPVLERCFMNRERNLFEFLRESLATVLTYLSLDRPVRRSSSLDVDPSLRGQDRVIATCEALGASDYINLPGGRSLYDAAAFARHRLALHFVQPRIPAYDQFGVPFVANLSVLDVMMHLSPFDLNRLLDSYELDRA